MLLPRIHRSLLTILARVAAGSFLGAQLAVSIASAQVLVGNPYVTGFEGWTSTYVTAPTQVGPTPSWGVLLTPDPLSGERFLFEASDGREADSVTTAMLGDGKYKPYLMINTADTTPANYTINYQLASMDNDGFGVVFGYQDNNNYFRVGFREQADGNLGFEEGTSVQKVVNGVITNLANSQAGFVPPSSGATFDAKVVVNGTNWDIQVNNASVLNGTDPDLKPGKYGVHSWAQREVGTTLATPTYGTMVGPISVTSATLNKTTNFVNALSSVPWRRVGMMNAVGETGIAQGEDYGNFAQDFTNGTIRDDSNGFADATAGAPNTDFIGPAIVVNSPTAAAMTNYRFTTCVENRDNDGLGLLVRVQDDDSFYRINWATEGPGTGTTRPPLGMSVQKFDNGTWTQVFTETTPKFLPADSVPFDVSVQVVGNSIKIDVLDNPDAAPRSVSYDAIVDSAGPILMGSVGFTNWGNGDGGNGAVYSAFGGDGTALVSAISTITDLDLTVDRSTNNVRLTNNGSAAVAIREVSILSPNGALNPATWTSISDNYDETPGNGSVDSDDPWTELTATAVDLTEREQSAGGNGGTLTAGETVDLGNIWQKSQLQDLALVVELVDGSTQFGGVTYTAGPGGMAYGRSDLNVDGVVNASDWSFFYPNMLSDLSAMTGIQRALAGDLDRDGDVDVTDFVSFKTDFDAANGAGAFNVMLARVPEPSTIAIVLVAGAVAAFARQRRKCRLLFVIALSVLASGSLGDRLSAAPVDLTTFDVEAFQPAATFPAPIWDITPSTASLNNNSDATVLFSPTNVINKRITGTLTPGTDDDVVGFVLGFEPGDSAAGSTADYILIDWKGANQNFNFGDPAGTTPEFHNLTGAGDMPAGIAISRVTGSANADELWTHTDNAASPTGGVRQLARGSTLGSTPYNRTGGSHQFEIVYTDTLINVKVDGVEQFNVVGSFPAGRFGLYSAWQGPTATFSDVDIADDFTISALTATVDRSTGSITINNPFSTPVNFDFYQFTSASNSLNDDTWLSLSDQNFQPSGAGAHQKWQEAGGSSPSAIAEVYLDGNSTLDATTPSKSIGAVYNNLINGEDLVFQYRLITGALRTGFVQYVGTPPASLPGDYNMNGVVDAADYVVWRKSDGTPAGYNTWRTNFGRTSAVGAALDGAQSVPEPTSLGLALGIVLLTALRRRVPLLAAHR